MGVIFLAGLFLLLSATPAAADPVTATVIASFAIKVAIALTISFAISFITKALAPKPKTPQFDPGQAFESTAGRIHQIRQAITTRRTIYGEQRVSGPLLYATSTQDNKMMHLVIALAGHEIEAIDDVLLSNVLIHSANLDGNGLGVCV